MPYPAIFGGAGFSTSVVRKTVVQLGSLEGVLEPSPVGSRSKAPEKFCLFWILSSSKHPSCGSTHCGTSVWKVNCLFFDELIFTLLRVWGFEFGIPNPYTGFKIALDTALHMLHAIGYTVKPTKHRHVLKRKPT